MIDATADKASSYPRLLDWLRYFCAFMLFMYGFSKLLHLQFNLQSELAQRPIGSLTGYQLTSYYYGYSRIYACLLLRRSPEPVCFCFGEPPYSRHC